MTAPTHRGIPPTIQVLIAALATLLLIGLTTSVVMREPWFGASFRVSKDTGLGTKGNVEVIGELPSTQTQFGGPQRVRAIGDLDVQATDLIEEPDFFDSYAEMTTFFLRQSHLRRSMTSTLRLHLESGASIELVPQPRPLSNLPATYWFQLAAGSLGFLLSFWVYTLKPKEHAVRAFAVLGTTILIFTFAAAIYSSRTLALPGPMFRVLASLNHFGAFAFGAALIVLFIYFPRRMGPRWLPYVPMVLFGLWWTGDALHLAPNQDVGSRLPVLVETVCAVGLAFTQRWRARGDAQAQALLRTFGVSVLLGAGMFVLTTAGSSMLGGLPVLPQAYAFGFFLLMHLGLAISLRRHSVFALSQASYGVLLWVSFALLFLALDSTLVALTQERRTATTTLALVLSGAAYLPLRDWLWRRVTGISSITPSEASLQAFDVAFAPKETREELWQALLLRVFDAVEVTTLSLAPSVPTVHDDAVTLDLPSIAHLGGVRVRYPFRGKKLVGPPDLKLANEIGEALRRGFLTREEFQRGVRTERERLAQDLHDDVGSRLLTGVYQNQVAEVHATLREAIAEVRSIVHDLTGEPESLAIVSSAMQEEAQHRCSAAGLRLQWTSEGLGDLFVSEGMVRLLRSSCRELLANAIKHAQAQEAHAHLEVQRGQLTFRMTDNGIGLSQASTTGHGLDNLRKRAARLNGSFNIEGTQSGTEGTLRLQLVGASPQLSLRETR